MDPRSARLIMKLAEGILKPQDASKIEGFIKDQIKRVWDEDLIVEDMETEQIWYQVEEILRPHMHDHLDEQLDGVEGSEEVQDEDGKMEEEDIGEEDDGEYDQSVGEEGGEGSNSNEDGMDQEDDDNIDEENDDNIEEDEEDDGEIDEEEENPDMEEEENIGNGEDNSKGSQNDEADSYKQYEFDDEEYNQYLDDMDEQDINEEQEVKDEEEAEMEEEDDDDEQDREKEEDDDVEDAEDVFRTLAYGTHEKNIEQIEKHLVEKKGWQLRGEIRAKDREKNTLLEEDLEFQRGIQTKTKISKEGNEKFETIIKQRILDLAFDDRSSSTYFNKAVVTEQVRNLPELDFEKDKRGLAGIYEDQYKKSVMGIDEKKTKEDKLKDQIKDLYRLICFSIDNMTRFQYNPSVVLLADKKVTNGFVMDEKIPIVVSADLLKDRKRFKDVYDPKDKEMKSKAEMTKEEKLRLRRKIKKTMKAKKERLQKKETERTGMRNSDYKILEKNQSKVKKQIQDSKSRDAAKFTRNSEFFATIGKNAN